jgi:hypothetical protein
VPGRARSSLRARLKNLLALTRAIPAVAWRATPIDRTWVHPLMVAAPSRVRIVKAGMALLQGQAGSS